VGAVSILILVVGRRLSRRIPVALIVVVLTTAAVPMFSLDTIGVAIVGEIPRGFPSPQVPMGVADAALALAPGAVIIALLAYLEGLSVARAIAVRSGDRIDPDQELIASGAANLAAGFFQAFPVAGGFSRSAVNHAAGARTPLAGIVAAAGVLVTLLVAAPLLSTLPQVVLAAVVLVAVTGLVDVRGAVHAWRVERTDGVALLVTFLATLLIGVEIGIGIGIVVSLVLSLYRVGSPGIEILDEPNATTLRVDGPLLPASGVALRDTVDAVLGQRERERVGMRIFLDLTGVPSADGSGVDALVAIDHACAATGTALWLIGVRDGVLAPLRRAGQMDRFGDRIRPVEHGSPPEEMSVQHDAFTSSNAPRIPSTPSSVQRG
jgi:sulfate permease, SulP family